jgi:hypothetical protein
MHVISIVSLVNVECGARQYCDAAELNVHAASRPTGKLYFPKYTSAGNHVEFELVRLLELTMPPCLWSSHDDVSVPSFQSRNVYGGRYVHGVGLVSRQKSLSCKQCRH